MDFQKITSRSLAENSKIAALLEDSLPQIELLAKTIIEHFEKGGKLIFLGNGGSASDAIHLAGEYVSKFFKARKSFPALALTDNVAILTSIGNDYDYEYIFTRQLESLAQSQDLVVCLTTSGESKNIINALRFCGQNKLATMAFTGSKPNTTTKLSTYCFQAPTSVTARIQETYLLINHIICELLDEYVCEGKDKKTGLASSPVPEKPIRTP